MPWLLTPLLLLAAADATSQYEWARTMDVAGAQRMLTQRMSKEFLLVALGFEAEVNKAALNVSAHRFDGALKCLMQGCPEEGIMKPASDLLVSTLETVLKRWKPLMELLLSSVDTVRNSWSGRVDYKVLQVLSTENIQLLVESNTVVSRLVDAAGAAGVPSLGRAEDIAARQRMVIQRICKEVFLVGLGVDVDKNLASLRSTYALFANSHRGIITGAGWAGVSGLTKRCTLQIMREVSHEWNIFKSSVNQILVAATPQESTAIAHSLTKAVSDSHKPLFATMVQAVQSFFHDDDSCAPPKMSEQGWASILDAISTHRTSAQQSAQHFLEVWVFLQAGERVHAEHSQVELTVTIKRTSTQLRDLVEGSKAQEIPVAPTQEIIDQLQVVSGTWTELEELLTRAVTEADVDPFTVQQVFHLRQRHYDEVSKAITLYEAASEQDAPGLNASLIGVLKRQGTFAVSFAAEALQARLLRSWGANGTGGEPDLGSLDAARDRFRSVHRQLLLGPPLPEPSLCQVQSMGVLDDRFKELEEAAYTVARGGKAEQLKLVKLLPKATAAVDAVQGQYVAQLGTGGCELPMVTYEEWLGTILELGNLRALVEKATMFKVALPHSTHHSAVELQRTRQEMRESLLKVAFGSGLDQVLAPFSEETLAMSRTLLQRAESLAAALDEQGAMSHAVADAGARVVEQVAAITGRYVEAALSDKNKAATENGKHVPARRVELSSQLIMLMNRAVKEALLERYDSTGEGALDRTIVAFDAAFVRLRDGGNNIPAMIPERTDLIDKWRAVENLWRGFRSRVKVLASAKSTQQSLQLVLQSLRALESELKPAPAMFGLQDPYVEPKFPYTELAYCTISVFFLLVMSAACFASSKARRNELSAFGGDPEKGEKSAKPV